MRWLIAGLLFVHGYQSADEDAWFASLRMPDNPAISCCGKADHYWADRTDECKPGDAADCYLVAIVTDPRHIHGRADLPDGTRISIPHSKIRRVASDNPTDHTIVFVQPVTRMVYCYEPVALN